jgi:ATP-dependent helicase/nuclease subunit B
MLSVVTGRFRPALESALVTHIQGIKAVDVWSQIAIVVPSKPLLDRIRWLLAVEHQLAFVNVHLLTFHQLALRLAEEIHREGTGHPPRVVDDLFFEYLVRHLVQRRLAELPALRQLGRSFGTWAGLWSTVRDLNDGGVDPATVLRAVGEDYFDPDEADWLRALFSLHAAVREVGRGLHLVTADDLTEAVLPAVSTSPFLTSLSHIAYYGFYDLTQVQLSMFQAVSGTVSTTLFFPLATDSSFDFARRFFDRHVQPLLKSNDALVEAAETGEAFARVDVAVRSVVGLEEELAVACRTILDLVETHGYRFDEIGVVARTLDPYHSAARNIFDRHRIPFSTTARRPLIHEPLCKTVLALASLSANDFYRAAMLDLVTSPFYRGPRSSGRFERSPSYRPEQWKLVLEALHITHGLDEWTRLKQASQSALEWEVEDEAAGTIGSVKIAPDVIGLLWETVSELLKSHSSLPARGTIGSLLPAFRELMANHVHRVEEEHAIWSAVDQACAAVNELDAIGEEITWPEFAELLAHAFERVTIPLEATPHQGVKLLDAMTARGVPFKALFVLGLNEKVFPRYVREDAFLRDRHRRVLDATLGFKIDEKLAGYDEERLLFSLICGSAVRRLYLSFQRADDAGRMLAASPYIGGELRRLGFREVEVEMVPRRLSDRIKQRPTISRFLPPEDLAQWMAGRGEDPAELLQATGRDATLFHRGVEALGLIEDDRAALTAFDGMTGPLKNHWARIAERGIAPTPLERYASCPFKYFSADVLRLDPVRVPPADEPDARLLGTVCHAALRRCYELLLPTGWPVKPVTNDTIDWCVETAVEQAAGEQEILHRTGHYLLWELAKSQIIDVVTAAVDDDTRAYLDEPFIPIVFEVDADGSIDDLPLNVPSPLRMRGRIDRVDRHRVSGALRVIDYKFKIGNSMKSQDRNLALSAVRGYRLQPPMYARLNVPDHGRVHEVQLFFLAPHWPTPVVRSTFKTDLWSSDSGTSLRTTFALLVDGLRNGTFFILPDTYCETCDYRVACRREHTLTSWRASRAAEAKALTLLRTSRVNDA